MKRGLRANNNSAQTAKQAQQNGFANQNNFFNNQNMRAGTINRDVNGVRVMEGPRNEAMI